MADSASGLVCAYALDGSGGGRLLGWDEIRAWLPGSFPLWVHLDIEVKDSQQWLRHDSGVDSVIAEALSDLASRPRVQPHKGGLLLSLRGVNLNPGADQADMVALQGWVDADRIITTRHRHLTAVEDVKKALADEVGPCDTGDLVVMVARNLMSRMRPAIEELEDEIGAIDYDAIQADTGHLRTKLTELRRRTIAFRRYVAPERSMIGRLSRERTPIFNETQRIQLRELNDQITRFVEDLDSARDRASVTHEEISQLLAERMNRTMMVLSVVAAIFLPAGLVIALFSMTIPVPFPGADTSAAFGVVVFALLVLTAVQIWFFRKAGWF